MKQLQNILKTVHSVYLAIHLHINRDEIHNSLGPPRVASALFPETDHDGGWGDKWLNKVDEPFLQFFELFG